MGRALPELLAPAGDEAAFRCALAGGADAIYCGLSSLNARRGATNFTDEAFERCCRTAHVLGTRVYLTLNVAIKDAELDDAIRLAEHATALGADALIIQDLGLLSALHELHPEMELHVSTQANVHDARGVLWCGRLGASRVTLSRELSLPEIREICAAGAEAGVGCEVFCHGALCMSYSGLCLMSSLRGRRSANRGLCAQPCRLPHRLFDGDGRPLTPEETRALCPKDFSATAELAVLVDAGVASLKIEGRMKAPDYVLTVTRAWRDLLDALEIADDEDSSPLNLTRAASSSVPNDSFETVDIASDLARDKGLSLQNSGDAVGEHPDCLATGHDGGIVLPDEALATANHRLKRAFNRDFTTAYLHGRSGRDMMSPERSNNRGELMGEVIAARGRRATVRLDGAVGEGDLLELRPIERPDQFLATPSPRDTRAGERLELELKRPMPVGTPVRVLREARAIAEAKVAGGADWPRSRQVRIAARAVLGEPLSVTLMTRARTPEEQATYGDVVTAEAKGPVVEPARTKELTAPELAAHADRLGNTPFTAVDVDAYVSEGAGLSFSTIHKVRAEAVARLEQALLAPYATRSSTRVFSGSEPLRDDVIRVPKPGLRSGATSSTRRKGSAELASGAAIELCCLAASTEVAGAAREAGADRLYLQFQSADPSASVSTDAIPWLDEVCREVDHSRIDSLVHEGAPCVVSNVSELALAMERHAPFEVSFDLPVFNRATVRLLEGEGAEALWLSFELSESELASVVATASVPCGVTVSGALRAMTTEHCVLKQAGRCTRDCTTCVVAASAPILENIDGRRLPVTSAPGHRSRIWWDEPVDFTAHLDRLRSIGIRRLLLDARLMGADEAAREVIRLRKALESGHVPALVPAKATLGHFLQPVD